MEEEDTEVMIKMKEEGEKLDIESPKVEVTFGGYIEDEEISGSFSAEVEKVCMQLEYQFFLYLLEVDIDEVVLVLIVMVVEKKKMEVEKVVVEEAEKTFLYIVCKYMCMYTIMYVITYVCK